MNIVDLITRNAAQRPDQPAIIDGDRTVTYGEMVTLTQKTASHLQSLGIKPGDRLGISLKDNLDHVIAIMAAASVGAAIVPIDWRARPAEKQRLAEAFKVAAVLTEPGTPAPDGVPCVPLNETWHVSVAAAPQVRAFQTDGSHTFILNLSSGTSGQPKGAVVTHDDYRYRAARYPVAYGTEGGHRYLSVMPLCFSAGRNLLLMHLMMRGTVILYPPLFGPEEYIEAATRYDITFAFLVPTAVRWLLNLPEQSGPMLPGLRVWGTGTAFMSPDEKREAARRIAPNMVAGYSSSGTGGISTLRADELAEHAGTVGRPYLLTNLEIVDHQDRLVPTGKTGRVRCQGPGTSRSYFGDVTDSAGEGIRGDWFYTGELGALDEAGYLHLHGRSSSLIIRGGANVYPEEVEQVILGHNAVAEAAVIGRPSPDLGEEVVAAIVAKRPIEQNDLLAFCRKELSSYKIPTEIRMVQSLPKTTSGKVKRGKVLARFNNAQPMTPARG
ncbi:MAG: class I adenylate-forming enzyme family protein [Alphaproteobacteria bacterium]